MAKKTLAELKVELLADPATRAEYEALEGEFAFAALLTIARVQTGLSQTDVAARMGTTQSIVARLEGGKVSPSLATLRRYAAAIGIHLT